MDTKKVITKIFRSYLKERNKNEKSNAVLFLDILKVTYGRIIGWNVMFSDQFRNHDDL